MKETVEYVESGIESLYRSYLFSESRICLTDGLIRNAQRSIMKCVT